MALFLVVLLIVLAAFGVLKVVLSVALGVALGLVLAIALVAAFVGWRLRRLVRGTQRRWREAQGHGSSRVEVLDPRDLPPRGY